MQPLQRLLALLIVAAVAAQFFLAAAGAFGAISYSAHKTVGYTLVAAALVAVLVALVGRRQRLASLLLVVSLAVQVALGSLGTSSSSWFGAFHGLNALLVMATAGNLARRAAARPADSRAATRRRHTLGRRSN